MMLAKLPCVCIFAMLVHSVLSVSSLSDSSLDELTPDMHDPDVSLHYIDPQAAGSDASLEEPAHDDDVWVHSVVPAVPSPPADARLAVSLQAVPVAKRSVSVDVAEAATTQADAIWADIKVSVQPQLAAARKDAEDMARRNAALVDQINAVKKQIQEEKDRRAFFATLVGQLPALRAHLQETIRKIKAHLAAKGKRSLSPPSVLRAPTIVPPPLRRRIAALVQRSRNYVRANANNVGKRVAADGRVAKRVAADGRVAKRVAADGRVAKRFFNIGNIGRKIAQTAALLHNNVAKPAVVHQQLARPPGNPKEPPFPLEGEAAKAQTDVANAEADLARVEHDVQKAHGETAQFEKEHDVGGDQGEGAAAAAEKEEKEYVDEVKSRLTAAGAARQRLLADLARVKKDLETMRATVAANERALIHERAVLAASVSESKAKNRDLMDAWADYGKLVKEWERLRSRED